MLPVIALAVMLAVVVGYGNEEFAPSVPLIVKPETVTFLPVPTVLLLNVPAALPVLSVTASPDTTPTNAALLVLSVAVVLPSYTLLLAVMPETVSIAAEIFAVVVALVELRT